MGGEGEEGYIRTRRRWPRDLALLECYSGGGGQACRPNAARTNARTHALSSQQLSPWRCSASCTSAAWQVHRRRQRRTQQQADSAPGPGDPPSVAAQTSSPSQPTAGCSVPAPAAAWRREFGEPLISGFRFARARWLARPLHFLCLHRDSATTSTASLPLRSAARVVIAAWQRFSPISCPPDAAAAEVVVAPCSSSAVTRSARCAMAIVCRPLHVRGFFTHGPCPR